MRWKVRYISVFSGIEAATVAWEPLGWEPVAFCEIDTFPSAVLAHRFPNVPNLGDITRVDWSEYYGEVDLIVGGSPCQSFSIAGKREGLKGESGLMFEYIRAVREVMPRYFIWENVPGALSCEKGAAFGQLLREMDALGYGLAWRVLDAQFFDVAQRRERVFLVGCLGDAERAAEILFEQESLRWDSTSSREKREELAARAKRGAGGSFLPINTMVATRGGKLGRGTGFGIGENGEAQFTLSTAHSHGVAYCINTLDVPAVAAGFKYHQGAKAGNIGYVEEQSPTMTADQHPPAAVYKQNENVDTLVYNQRQITSQTNRSVTKWKDPCHCIASTDGATEAILKEKAYTLKIRSGCEGGGKGPLIQEDVSATLATNMDQTLFQPANILCLNDQGGSVMDYSYEIGPTLRAQTHGHEPIVISRAAFSQGVNAKYDPHIEHAEVMDTLVARGSHGLGVGLPMQVRKLTPKECERLQGFPDGWTEIPYRGKPADKCPDTPRYKALGNSMAVPVMRWIGERIDMVELALQPLLPGRFNG